MERSGGRKWTEGKWLALDTASRDLIIGVPSGNGYIGIARTMRNSRRDEQERRANANLIAAAPALYKALDALVRSLSDQDDEGLIEHAPHMVAARAALSQASGEPG